MRHVGDGSLLELSLAPRCPHPNCVQIITRLHSSSIGEIKLLINLWIFAMERLKASECLLVAALTRYGFLVHGVWFLVDRFIDSVGFGFSILRSSSCIAYENILKKKIFFSVR